MKFTLILSVLLCCCSSDPCLEADELRESCGAPTGGDECEDEGEECRTQCLVDNYESCETLERVYGDCVETCAAD